MLPTAEKPVLILEGCALTMLRTLPDACVDALVTSPPYWGLRDYGIQPTDWPACSYAPMPGLPALAVPAERSCLGLEPTLHAFLAHLVLIFEEGRRVLKPTGSACVNMGDGYAAGGKEHGAWGLKAKDLQGQPWRVAFALQAAGWYLRQDNIWHKVNPMPESIRDRATKAHEYVFHLTKAERYFFDLEAWSEPVAYSSVERLSQNVAAQNGSDRAHAGGKTNGRMKAVINESSRKSLRSDIESRHRSAIPGGQSLCAEPGLTRNKRSVWSVWSVPTVAYSEAHYATYPPKLITPPILASTSAAGCCRQCGSPWERVVEKTLMPTAKACKKQVQDSRDAAADTQDQGSNRQKDGHMPGWANRTTTTGWQPTCKCYTGYPFDHPLVPAIVLDPFGGSGTTAQVALEHGRHAILIERGPHNISLIHKRLAPFLAAPVLNLH